MCLQAPNWDGYPLADVFVLVEASLRRLHCVVSAKPQLSERVRLRGCDLDDVTVSCCDRVWYWLQLWMHVKQTFHANCQPRVMLWNQWTCQVPGGPGSTFSYQQEQLLLKSMACLLQSALSVVC